jgi:hypothetical protein
VGGGLLYYQRAALAQKKPSGLKLLKLLRAARAVRPPATLLSLPRTSESLWRRCSAACRRLRTLSPSEPGWPARRPASTAGGRAPPASARGHATLSVTQAPGGGQSSEKLPAA